MRIQTAYLFVVFLLETTLFFSRQVTALATDGSEQMFVISRNWQWALLAALTALIALVCVFLRKKRELQVRLSIINAVLLLGLQGVIAYYAISITNAYSNVNYSFTIISPIVSFLLTILAIRFIRKDIERLRSYDRLR